MKKRILVVGGGISGLAFTHALSRSVLKHAFDITLVERTHRLGGWIDTTHDGGFLMERGPRSLLTRRGEHTVSLVEELGLDDEVITADPQSAKRYIWMEGSLHMLPTGLNYSLLKCRPMKGILTTALLETFQNQSNLTDESVYDFIARRFSTTVADNLIDPMVAGIYAGDPKKLSVHSCFKMLPDFEQSHGSVVRGMFSKPKKSGVPPTHSPLYKRIQKNTGIYSFKGGMSVLAQRLAHYCKKSSNVIHVRCNTTLDPNGLSFEEDGVRVRLRSQNNGDNVSDEKFDYVVSTINSSSLSSVLQKVPNASSLCQELSSIVDASVCVVNVGFKHNVIHKFPGFGFLVPTSQKDADVLGVTFDSYSFPQQNNTPKEARLTVMMGGTRRPDLLSLTNEQAEEVALKNLRHCLGIRVMPDYMRAGVERSCIPQYYVGHTDKMRRIESLVAQLGQQRLSVLGSSFYGVSVNDCVRRARELSHVISSPAVYGRL